MSAPPKAEPDIRQDVPATSLPLSPLPLLLPQTNKSIDNTLPTPPPPCPSFDRKVHIEAQGEINLELVEKVRELVMRDEPSLAHDTWVLGDQAVWRYLCARKMDIAGTRKQMVAALKWRQMRNPDAITPNEIKIETCTGKCAVRGLDQFSRPVIVMDSTKENTYDPDGNMKGLIFTLNRAIALMRAPVQKYVILVRLGETSAYNMSKLPGPTQTRETAKILMTVFAERMGHAILYQPPKIFTVFLSLLEGLLDKHVMEKIVWVRGDVSPNSANDKTMCELIGPHWREIVGEGQPVYAKNTAPGYNPDLEWDKILAEWEERQHKERVDI